MDCSGSASGPPHCRDKPHEWIGPLGGVAASRRLDSREIAVAVNVELGALDPPTPRPVSDDAEESSLLPSSLEQEIDDKEETGRCIDGASPHIQRAIPWAATIMLVGLLSLGMGPIVELQSEGRPSEGAVATPAPPRLLESDEFAEAAARHAIEFHRDFNTPVSQLSPELLERLREELTKEARLQARRLVERVEETHPTMAGHLRELRLTPKQWEHTRRVLAALHDKRVQDVGRAVAEAAAEAAGGMQAKRRAAARQLASRQGELAGLQSELIPAEVRKVPKTKDGHAPWELSIGPAGEVRQEGPIGDWHAILEVSPPRQAERRLAEVSRRLQTQNPDAVQDALLRSMFYSMSLVVAALTGIATTIVSSLFHAGHNVKGSEAIWFIQLALNMAGCGMQLGLNLGSDWYRGWVLWIPCMILSAFTGVEAIWSFTP